MLKLRDLFQVHLEEKVLKLLIDSGPGLTVVAGPEGSKEFQPQEHNITARGLLPSGRSMVFRSLVEEIIDSNEDDNGIIITQSPGEFNLRRGGWRQFQTLKVDAGHSYADRIMDAVLRNPGFILVDEINERSAVPALEAAMRGQRVLSQLNAPLRGQSVYRQIMTLGATQSQLRSMQWVLSVYRLPMLCSHCKRAVLPNAAVLNRLDQMLKDFSAEGVPIEPPPDDTLAYSDAPGCQHCQFTGLSGDVSVLDLSRFEQGRCESILPIEACLWQLVQKGILPLDRLLAFDQEILLGVFNDLRTTEQQINESQSKYERTRSELTSVNRVLEQRNQALFSYQDIGYALIRSNDLYDLAARICRRASELCQADRAVLYYKRTDNQVEIASVCGWGSETVHQLIPADLVFNRTNAHTPRSFKETPPGVHSEPGSEPASDLSLNGLFVPLISQKVAVGAMVIQNSTNTVFSPAETAMVQAFANQAAVALQRAGLVADLRSKIDALEKAQEALAEKERMQREMELARQVQQSVLPHSFPTTPGFQFAARSIPSRQVGGDFYDIAALDENYLAITIADVSDKGMPAALYMVLTRTLLVAQSRRTISPSQVLREVNQLIQELSNAGMFVTIFYGVLEKSTARLRYARAGHDQPVLLTGGKQKILLGDLL
jgi:hypothetical protein